MASAGTAYIDVEAKLDEFSSQVDAAVSSIDTQTIDVQADTGQAQADIDAIEGGTTSTEVTADTTQAQAGVDDLSGAVDGLADSVGAGGGILGSLTDELAGVAGASSAATVGMGALVGGLMLSVDAAGESQAVNAQLDQILQNAGDSAAVTGDHIRSLATDIMEYSGFSDEAVISGASLLATFDNIAGSQPTFDRTLKASADLAVFMGTDVPAAAKMLGRALNDPEQGVNRLARVFPSLTAAEKESISAMAEAGDIAGAQAAIFDIVEGKVGGLAAAYGETLPGEIDKAKESLGELAEAVGTDMVPALSEGASGLAGYVRALTDLQEKAGDIGGGALGELQEFLTRGAVQSVPFFGPFINDLTSGDEAAEGFAESVSFSAGAAEALGVGGQAAADGVAALNDELLDYFDKQFAVPEAQRALGESFDDLFETLLAEGHTADDVAVALEQVAIKTGELGVATGDMDAAVAGSTYGLATLANQSGDADGQIAGMIDTLGDVPGQTNANVAAPGAAESTVEVKGMGEALRKIPGNYNAHTRAIVDAVQLDRLIRELDYIDTHRFTAQVSVNTVGSPMGLPGREMGGPVEAGEAYVVGERQPEVFVPDRPGTILPSVPDGRSVHVGAIHVHAAPGADGDALARIISEELRRLERAGA